MKLRKFNFGGLFGGLVCAGAAIIILYLLSEGEFKFRGIKLIALAGFGGAALGNWIWRLAEPKTTDEVFWENMLNRAERQDS
jgi:hypothetical protein